MVFEELTDVGLISRALGLAEAAAAGENILAHANARITEVACLSAALGLALRNLPPCMVEDAAEGSLALVRRLAFGQPLCRRADLC